MRSTKWGFLLLMGVALVFSAAGVSAQVIDGEFDIEDDRSDSTAFVDAEGDDYQAQVSGVCTSGTEANLQTVTITVTSSHPDSVKISDKKAQVAQRDKTNLVSSVNVDHDDADTPLDNFNVDLNCSKKSTVDVSVQPSKNSGKFKADLQDCTGLNASQGATVALVCDGNKAVKGKFDDSVGDISKLKISGKGSVSTTTTTTTTTAPPTTTTTLPIITP
jgi:hypothetical protein